MKRLYVVTHGFAEMDKPEPSLTIEGKEQLAKIKKTISKINFDLIVVGTGKRHKESFEFLFGRYKKPDVESELVGVSETLGLDKKTMIFPKGRKMPVEEYAKTVYPNLQRNLSSLIKNILKRRGKNALIIGGRIVPHTLGVKEPTSGTLYVFDKKLNLINIVFRGYRKMRN